MTRSGSDPNLGPGSFLLDLRKAPEGVSPLRIEHREEIGWDEGEDSKTFRDLLLTGEVTRSGRSFRMLGKVVGRLETGCDRCLLRFDRPVEVEFVLRVEQDGGNSPPTHAEWGGEDKEDSDFFVKLAPDVMLDLSDPIREAVFLDIPIKNICRADCRGLCPRCGGNRNTETCGCDPSPRDLRWSALDGLRSSKDDQE